MLVDSIIEKIQTLDLTLFEGIPSQTTADDRLALLAVQRVTAETHKEYDYLEIGSYLGGSIQPHLLDPRCKNISSIDSRNVKTPDDRPVGYFDYESNSSERMLELLRAIDPCEVSKLRCFDMDSSEIDPNTITSHPQIAFIDGEHTRAAVLSDFLFCKKVLSNDGTILFHDFRIIYPAIIEICKALNKSKRHYKALKFRDNVFAIFFDEGKIHSDPYLSRTYALNRHAFAIFRLKEWIKNFLPAFVLNVLRSARRKVARTDNVCCR